MSSKTDPSKRSSICSVASSIAGADHGRQALLLDDGGGPGRGRLQHWRGLGGAQRGLQFGVRGRHVHSSGPRRNAQGKSG